MTKPLTDAEIEDLRGSLGYDPRWEWSEESVAALFATIDALKERSISNLVAGDDALDRAEKAERQAAAMRSLLKSSVYFDTSDKVESAEYVKRVSRVLSSHSDNAGADFFTEAQVRECMWRAWFDFSRPPSDQHDLSSVLEWNKDAVTEILERVRKGGA